MRKFQLVILVLLITQSLGNKLTILDEQGGAVSTASSEFSFSIADFGDIPYGQTVIGAVQKASPFDACTKIESVDHNKINGSVIPIVLIQRGGPGGIPSANCHFVDKVKNAENAGYKIAIIEDNIFEMGVIVMADDGRGYSIHIPSIFITQKDGAKIEQILSANENTTQLVYIKIQFEVEQKQTSEYTFIMQPNDRLTQSFLLQFDEYRQAFASQTKFNLRYNFYRCEGCINNPNDNNSDCLGGGRYCQSDPDGSYLAANGQTSGFETIRQICIYERYGEDAWYQYIKNFYRYCPSEKALEWEECSVREQKLIGGVDPNEIQQCFYNSFVSAPGKSIEKQENLLLQKYLPAYYETYFTSSSRMTIKINNITYFGKFNPYDVAEAICASLLEPSDLCKRIEDGLVIKSDQTISNEELLRRSGMSVTSIVLITVGVLVVIFIIILVIYKKLVGREMVNEMDSQVNEMVTNYIKFYEQKDKSKSNMV